MKYHEIGERFEYEGVVLEVMRYSSCSHCYFDKNTPCGHSMDCDLLYRKDGETVCFKLVEQLKTKDMKDVDYHKVGERFEYEGVTLEVKEAVDISGISCDLCYLRQMCSEIRYLHQPPIRNCSLFSRKDGKSVYYVPVDEDYEHITEQEGTTDMEQKAEIKVADCEGKPKKKKPGISLDVCKAGDTFVCVRSVIDGDNVTRFTMGKIYECHTDNNLVNDNGVEEDWGGCIDFAGAFVKVEDGFNARPTNAEIPKKERVNHPDYYNRHPSGVECITIIRHYNFNVGNAIKYLWRQGLKTEEGMTDKDKQIEDLKKAMFYIADEIKRLEEF